MDRREGPRQYTPDLKAALPGVWEACGCICSKRLTCFLPGTVAMLKWEGGLRIQPKTEIPFVQLSPAIIGRLLRTRRLRLAASQAHSCVQPP
ncbi:MAG: hypothetical protein QXI12_12795 [Candidatus Methanomethyliaceae archaeon]